MKLRTILIISSLFLFLFSGLAFAHKPSDSYVHLKIQGKTILGQWDIALRDLDYAIGLDGDNDGQITWENCVLDMRPSLPMHLLVFKSAETTLPAQATSPNI